MYYARFLRGYHLIEWGDFRRYEPKVPQLAQNIFWTLRYFTSNPVQAAESLEQMMQDDWASFEREVLQVLSNPAGVAGSVFLLSFLQKKGLLWRWIEDVERLPLETSAKIADFALLFDRDFDLRLTERLEQHRIAEGGVRLRLVELIERVSRGSRAIERIKFLADDPDKRVRSKVVRLLGRISGEAADARRKLGDPDPRVRAAAVEALWGHAAEHGRPVFTAALDDPNHRVRGNAVYGLYRLDDPACLLPMRQLLEDSEELARRAGLWAVEQTRDPRFLPVIAKMMASAGPEARSRCLRAMTAVRDRKGEAVEAGRLEVRLGLPSRAPEGFVVVPVRCEREGQPADGIRALDFVIYEDGRAVDAYSVEAVRPSPLLALEDVPAGELAERLRQGVMAEPAPGRILIATTGAQEEDWGSVAGSAGKLVSNRLRVDAVVWGTGPSYTRLKVLAEIAGGRFFPAEDREHAGRIADQLRGSYDANYQIRYQGPGGLLKVEIYGAKGAGETSGRLACI